MHIERQLNQIIAHITFHAPIIEVFKAYTIQSLFEQWFHPPGAKIKVYHFEAVTGGKAFYAITTPEATSYTLTEYHMVQAPYQIVYFDFFATKDGDKDTRLPGMKVVLEFKQLNKQQTEVTSTTIFPTATAAEQALSMGFETGMRKTLTQLERLLKKELS